MIFINSNFLLIIINKNLSYANNEKNIKTFTQYFLNNIFIMKIEFNNNNLLKNMNKFFN